MAELVTIPALVRTAQKTKSRPVSCVRCRKEHHRNRSICPHCGNPPTQYPEHLLYPERAIESDGIPPMA